MTFADTCQTSANWRLALAATWVVATVTACAPSVTPEQALIAAAARALGGGADRVNFAPVLVLEGVGIDSEMGGGRRPDADPNRWAISSYRWTLDLAGRRSRVEQVRTAQFPTGLAVVTRQDHRFENGVAYDVDTALGDPGTAPGRPLRLSRAATRARSLDMWLHPVSAVRGALEPAAQLSPVRIEGDRVRVDVITTAGETFTVGFDADSDLPLDVAYRVPDAQWGDVTVRAVFSEYESVDGLILPRRTVTWVDGWQVASRTLTAIRVADTAASFPTVGGIEQAPEPRPVDQMVPVQRVAEHVWWLTGSSHRSVVFEFDDHLVLFEVPLAEARTRAVIDTARSLSPKPLTHAIVSHHHLDHAGGVRTAVAAGLTIVTNRINEAWLREVVERSHRLNPDRLESRPAPLRMELVGDSLVLEDATLTVHLYQTRQVPHMASGLYAWIPGSRLVVQADLFDNSWLGFPWGGALLGEFAARGITPLWHVPVHGPIQRHAEVIRLLAQRPAQPPPV